MLADVALGKMWQAKRDTYMEKPKPGHHSTWALGSLETDPSQWEKLDDGCVVPKGSIKASRWDNLSVSCREHQYVTYDTAQSKLRYMLKVKWVY